MTKSKNIIKSFSSHPSIIKIKHKFKLNKKFFFQCVSEATVRKVVKSLPSNKATAGEIPVNVLKNSELCFFGLSNCINEANYRPVSVSPLLSKVSEKIIYISFMNV